jgi:hypothetical protein
MMNKPTLYSTRRKEEKKEEQQQEQHLLLMLRLLRGKQAEVEQSKSGNGSNGACFADENQQGLELEQQTKTAPGFCMLCNIPSVNN